MPDGTGNEPPASDTDAQIRTFLIADVRGYTLFTQQHGDEAAAKLAARFAELAREVVETRSGSVIELRGDEALAVFASARQAVRAAVDMQERFVNETLADPTLPMPVGIGLDAGEAVPFEGGYRGGALNLAARLCGQAGPGEILASRGVIHLSRHIEGIRSQSRGTVRLKNIPEPVELVRILPEGEDPAERLRSSLPPSTTAGPRRRRARILIAAATAAAIVGIGLPLLVGGDAPDTVRAGAVGALDIASGNIIGDALVGDLPRGVAEGGGSVWVTDQAADVVVHVDTSTMQAVERIPVGAGPAGVVTAQGLVWVANSDDRTVSVVDPDAHEVVQTVVVGNAPTGMTVLDGRIWVTNAVDATVSEIETADGRVVGTHAVGDTPVAIAASAGGVWVANEHAGTLSRVTSNGGETQSIPVGRAPSAVAFGGGFLWVANAGDGTVSRIDPETATVTATVGVGREPTALTVVDGSVWVGDASEGTLRRIDAASGEVAELFDVGNRPRALAPGRDRVWIAAQAAPAIHRGGTLRVVTEFGAESVDPVAGDFIGSTALTFTHDGLVGLRRADGAAGMVLVPDLAVSIPVPSDEGRTYTFQLRDGIRFSDGRPVTPADVIRTFERAMTSPVSVSAGELQEILGASSCTQEDPESCDLSRGIVADEEAGTVTFHLAEPSPDFVANLVGPSHWIVPADTDLDLGREAPPGTGPYVLDAFDPDGSITLVRNPRFQEWSRDAQPDGFADRISIEAGVPPADQVAMVQQGEADVALQVPADKVEELQTRFADQLVPFSLQVLRALYVNTDRPPFDRPDARRALALAVDRQRLGHLFAVVNGDVVDPPVTCQLLPPDQLGYVPYCPFTRGGGDPSGTWIGPDLAAARELVRSSGTDGVRVVVSVPAYLGPLGEEIAATLDDLGYRSDLRLPDIDRFTYYGRALESTSETDVGFVGWGENYPSPAQFLVPLLACRKANGSPSVRGAGAFSLNLSRFCDPDLDRRLRRALSLRATDIYAASRAFATLDRDLTDLAPLIPFSTAGGALLVSERVGNVEINPHAGILLSQLWVR
jgi:peptide/nickel transport system substrate-binding protein